MNMLWKRIAHRIAYEVENRSILARMLLHPTYPIPDVSHAVSYLQNVSPDLGNSCWDDNGLHYEKRSCLLSVIVPAYNVEDYIVNCLESVLRQKVSFDYEVIVVNDASTDATPELLKRYESDERIRIIHHQQNCGLSAARNTGIVCAKGQYLCFVDSDDELSVGAMESLISVALQKQAKLVVGSYEKCHRNGKVQYTIQLENQRAKNASLPGFAWGKIIDYEMFRNLRFPEGYWFEDSIMAQIVHPICESAAYTVSKNCYKYYSNEEGITATAKGNPKSIDSLWITMRLLEERNKFQLSYTMASYAYFLYMVKLTYQRTKHLGVQVAQSVFVVQRMLLDRYYSGYQMKDDLSK